MREILASYYGERWTPITKLTPHHAAVVAPAENIARNFDRYQNSANYVIGNDGEVILCVPEEFRAYTSSNTTNDSMAVTVEIANETAAPEWRVSDKAVESLINLGVGVCHRHNLAGFTWTGDKNGTLTIHKMFASTACPGPYLESKMPYIAEEITRRVKENKNVVYTINLEELKSKGYTSLNIDFGQPKEEVHEKPEKPLSVGEVVTLSKNATVYGQNAKFADYIYNAKLFVREINGARVVISTLPTGAVTGAVDIKYIVRA